MSFSPSTTSTSSSFWTGPAVSATAVIAVSSFIVDTTTEPEQRQEESAIIDFERETSSDSINHPDGADSPPLLCSSQQDATTSMHGGGGGEQLYYCSPSDLLFFGILLYGFVLIWTNAVAWYNFLSVWRSIYETRYFDSCMSRRRSCSIRILRKLQRMLPANIDRQTSYVPVDAITNHRCPVCLCDFIEREEVTGCDDPDGCGQWFHKECLFDWLERSNACPCCRKDLLASNNKEKRSSWSFYWDGMTTSLLAAFGYDCDGVYYYRRRTPHSRD